MATCGFGKLVTDPCGKSGNNAECTLLSSCNKDVTSHLRSCNVADTYISSEGILILARAGMMNIYFLFTFSNR